jgi:D-serine deaminase-like pyridoxal phosphate-dependent protein
VDLSSLRTPCALVDRDRTARNTSRMRERLAARGVALRPHIKTHKCVEVARLQVQGWFGGVTASTLTEAIWFAERGFGDVTLAVPLAPVHAADAVAAGARMQRLGLLVDSDGAIDAVEAAASDAGRIVPVLLKVDCGYGRAGIAPDGDDGPRLARRMAASPHLDFEGVLAHAGHSYDCTSVEQIIAVAESERAVTARFADRLRADGIEVRTVSAGSTPTAVHGRDWTGITELRPGNYAFFDGFQAGLGSCTMDDCAMTVLTSVIGLHPSRQQVLVDAGALGLSKDPGPRHVDPECGYGVVLDLHREPLPLRVVALSQEHGQLRALDPSVFDQLQIGSRLQIVPNHSCLAAALYEEYVIVSKGEIVGRWKRAPLR